MSSDISPQPGIITYTKPFRIVLRDESDIWNPSLAEINKCTYDYVKLHRISTQLDIGLPRPLCLLVCFDGSLVLPAIEKFLLLETAVDTFNQVLGELLLGGIFYESIEPSDVDQCLFYPTGYVRAISINSNLNCELRTTFASPINSIILSDPPHITALELTQAQREGKRICSLISNISVNFILQGVSSFIGHHWANSLSNFWICIEQIITYLWEKEILKGERQPSNQISGRKRFLEDTRTWTSASRIEVLYQKSILDETVYHLLNTARKARNDLIHEGSIIEQKFAEASFDACFYLLAQIAYNNPLEMDNIKNQYKDIDPITHISVKESQKILDTDKIKFWMPAPPPIPGEKEWGDKPFEDLSNTMVPIEPDVKIKSNKS